MLRNEAENRQTRRMAWAALACLCTLTLSAATHSQTQHQSGPDENGKGEIACRLGGYLATVDVEVKDVNGLPVASLSLESFKVYEDGKRQKIAFWTNKVESELEESPIKYRLGYWPEPGNADWEFRKVRVKVRNSKTEGMSVTYDPQGYFAAPRNWVWN